MDIKDRTVKYIMRLQELSMNANKLNNNDKIKRFVRRPIASLAEDEFAYYLYDVLDDKNIEIFINANINGIRPDIIIVKNDIIVSIIELKVNIGFCRNIFDQYKDGKQRYKEKSQIHKRYKDFEKLKNKSINFSDGNIVRDLKLSNNAKLNYVITSLESYTGSILNDYSDFIKRNNNYKNKVMLYLFCDKYHYGKLDDKKELWPSKKEISESVIKYFNTEIGLNKLIESIKKEL